MASGGCRFRFSGTDIRILLGGILLLLPVAVHCGSITFSVSDLFVELQGEGRVKVGRFTNDMSDNGGTWNDFYSDPNLVRFDIKDVYFTDSNGDRLDGHSFNRENSGNFDIHQEDMRRDLGLTTFGSHMTMAPFAASSLCDLRLRVDVVKRAGSVPLDGTRLQSLAEGDILMRLDLGNISTSCRRCRQAAGLKIVTWFTGSRKARTIRASADTTLVRTTLGGDVSILWPNEINIDGDPHTLTSHELEVTSQNSSAVMSLAVPMFRRSATYMWLLKAAPLSVSDEGSGTTLRDTGSEKRKASHDVDKGNGCDVTGYRSGHLVFAYFVFLLFHV